MVLKRLKTPKVNFPVPSDRADCVPPGFSTDFTVGHLPQEVDFLRLPATIAFLGTDSVVSLDFDAARADKPLALPLGLRGEIA